MKAAIAVVAVYLAFLAAYVAGDCYMQNPRGSNDRLNGAGTNRDNDNRLFDSQNNAKGGYCYGPSMSFYEGSLLTIEWTNQHGCGIGKLECNIVIQYMCGKTTGGDEAVQIRDGTTETTIPNDPNTFNDKDANGDYKYGMHEPYSHYHACETRSRNKGLFVADRITRGNLAENSAATHTRQNNGGTRRGFECSEERDYYPYWHPNGGWKDIAVLVDNTKWCDLFQKESQNVMAKGQCLDNDGEPTAENNPRSCGEKGNKWTETPSYGLSAPDCQQAPYNRDNHLGNGAGVAQTNMYNWTLPTQSTEDCIKDDNCNCVLRIRYNISSADIDGWGFMDSQFNGPQTISEDPDVPVGGDNLSLAIDTTQFFRTFQDRSHVFHIRHRPDGVSAVARIFNLNVRGKRGNIVETYPATEYDFTPNNLEVRVGDYVHFQWTGCDTNPAGNAGEGRDGTDRSNIVQISNLGANYPATDDWLDSHQAMFESKDLRYRMAHLDQTDCLDRAALEAEETATGTDEDDNVRNCYKLNAASPYFDGGLIRMNNTGEFYYMNTRNNNFTNRGQKGTLTVSPLLPVWGIVLVVVGAATFVGAGAITALKLYSNSHAGSGVSKFFDKI